MSDNNPALAWLEGARATAVIEERDGVLFNVVTIESPAFEGHRVVLDVPLLAGVPAADMAPAAPPPPGSGEVSLFRVTERGNGYGRQSGGKDVV